MDLDYPGFPKYSSRMAAEAWRFALLDVREEVSQGFDERMGRGVECDGEEKRHTL